MTDFHALARDALATRVSEIDDASPSVAALYDLDSFLTFSDLWHDARRQLLARWTTTEVRTGWRTALLESPPEDAFWIHSFDRMRGASGGLVDAARSWKLKPPDRMFRPHHYVPQGLDGVAALHVALLSDLDPLAAVEFVATRSSEYLIWSGSGMIDLGNNEELVDNVLTRSDCRDAVLLAMACTLDHQCAELSRRANIDRWTSTDAAAEAEARAALDLLWRERLPARHSAIAKMILARDDAGDILGPWMRHLVRSADLPFNAESAPLSRLARLSLDALKTALEHGVEIEQSTTPDAACLVARMIATDGSDAQREVLWQQWSDLILSENESLERCGEIAWGVAGHTLAGLPDPISAWRLLASKLEPYLRRRARRDGWDHDDVFFPFVLVGINAAAYLGTAGQLLLKQVFETSLRHFLVGRPPNNHRSFDLPAYVFAACPSVTLESADIDAMLSRLPLQSHVELAQKQMVRPDPSRTEASHHEKSEDLFEG